MAPRGDDLQFRRQAREGQLKAHLVVAFTGGAMGHRVGTLGTGDFHLAFGDHRPRD